MCKRILILLCATLMLTACAHGTKPMPAPSSQVPNVDIPADLLARKPADLPQPESGARSHLLTNHIAVAKAYHAIAIDFTALVCAVTSQQGITINGASPTRPTWCVDVPRSGAVEHRPAGGPKAVEQPVDNLGPSEAP